MSLLGVSSLALLSSGIEPLDSVFSLVELGDGNFDLQVDGAQSYHATTHGGAKQQDQLSIRALNST